MSTHNTHWDSTDEDERPVRISSREPEKEQKTMQIVTPRAKRSPAAVVGVLLVAALGFAVFQGVNGMSIFRDVTGQVTQNEVRISIKQNTVDPVLATVRPGQKIIWKNDASIPHILKSDTLPTNDGKPFITTAIFPNTEYSFVVPTSATPGMYDYLSATSSNITGQIMIEQATTATTSSRAAQSVTSVSTQVSSIAAAPSSSSSVSAVQAAPVTGIPVNPHTIGSGEFEIPARTTNGIPTAVTTYANVTQHQPLTNAQSGTGLWVILCMMSASLLGVLYRYSRA